MRRPLIGPTLAIHSVSDDELDMMDRIYHRIEADGFGALTVPERQYFAVWWLEGEANNGTFHQFFANSSGELSADALAGLENMGARQMAELFRRACALFPGGSVPRDRNERMRALRSLPPTQRKELDELSDRFVDYPDDLRALVEKFVLDHEGEFRGPRTLLERWEACKARGLPPPIQTSSDALARATAKDAAAASSRPCPQCGQPTPGYRVTCKRCGFPLGRSRADG